MKIWLAGGKKKTPSLSLTNVLSNMKKKRILNEVAIWMHLKLRNVILNCS